MDEVERLVVSVRADTAGFARDVAEMRGQMEGPLADSAARAGRMIENALGRAIRTGTFGFEDLKRVALGVLNEIADTAIRTGLGGSTGRGSESLGGFGSILTSLLGLPGRATGGGVSPGRAYMVGERGPEMFVPTAAGRVEAGGASSNASGAREVRVTINVVAPGQSAPEALTRSSRQIARAVRAAVMAAD